MRKAQRKRLARYRRAEQQASRRDPGHVFGAGGWRARARADSGFTYLGTREATRYRESTGNYTGALPRKYHKKNDW